MFLQLGQLVYTSFDGVGFKAVASANVPPVIRGAFIDRVVYQHWDTYKLLQDGYRAVYLRQVGPEHTLFGWVYNDGLDEWGRTQVPYFLCYYLAGLLDDVLLEEIFICLHKGPGLAVHRDDVPETLESIDSLDVWNYQPVCPGVEVAAEVRAQSLKLLQKKQLLNIFIPADLEFDPVETAPSPWDEPSSQQSLSTSTAPTATKPIFALNQTSPMVSHQPYLQDSGNDSHPRGNSLAQVEYRTGYSQNLLKQFSQILPLIVGASIGVITLVMVATHNLSLKTFSLEPKQRNPEQTALPKEDELPPESAVFPIPETGLEREPAALPPPTAKASSRSPGQADVPRLPDTAPQADPLSISELLKTLSTPTQSVPPKARTPQRSRTTQQQPSRPTPAAPLPDQPSAISPPAPEAPSVEAPSTDASPPTLIEPSTEKITPSSAPTAAEVAPPSESAATATPSNASPLPALSPASPSQPSEPTAEAKPPATKPAPPIQPTTPKPAPAQPAATSAAQSAPPPSPAQPPETGASTTPLLPPPRSWAEAPPTRKPTNSY